MLWPGLQWNDKFHDVPSRIGVPFAVSVDRRRRRKAPAARTVFNGKVEYRDRTRSWNMTHRHGKEGAEYVGAIQTAR